MEKTTKLIEKYNKNIIFVRLNTKQEILIGKSYWSSIAEDEIKKRNKKIHFCDFKNDIKLFYKYDGHPNKAGYDYLYDCILEILAYHSSEVESSLCEPCSRMRPL